MKVGLGDHTKLLTHEKTKLKKRALTGGNEGKRINKMASTSRSRNGNMIKGSVGAPVFCLPGPESGLL